MTLRNNISQHILRTALCLALLLCVSLNAVAKTEPEAPTKGEGSAASPYEISTPAHLLWLAESNTNSRWTNHYIQTKDIDMTGETLANAIGVYIDAKGNAQSPGFTGSYNGQNHVISNLDMKWVKLPMAAGLFGYVNGGTLKNIIIDGATITIDQTTEDLGTNSDFKVGILAGAISPKVTTGLTTDVTIENIYVLNSKIQEPEGTAGDIKIKSAFVGGVVGDVAISYGGYTAMGDNVKMSNIYSNVDIDLMHVQQTNGNVYQFNVGGVVGRIRFAPKSCLPKNTVYTGKINAPNATNSPVFGVSRVIAKVDGTDRDNYGDKVAEFFAGQMFTSGTSYEFLTEAEQYAFNKSHIFNNYQVYDKNKNAYVDASTIKTGYDVTYGGNTVHVYTLDGTTPLSSWTSTTLRDKMRCFQGVNLGASEGIKDWMLDCNTDNYDSMSQLWDYDNLNWTTTKPAQPTQSVSLEYDEDTGTYIATTSSTGRNFKWYYIDNVGRKTYIPTTGDGTLNAYFPTNAKKLVVYLAYSNGEKVVENKQIIKAECDITPSDLTVDFDLTFDNPTTTVHPYVKNSSNLLQTGYTFDIILQGSEYSHEYVIEDQTGDVELSPVAGQISVIVRAKKEGVEGYIESEPKDLPNYIDLSKVGITGKSGSGTTIWSYGHEFVYPSVKFNDESIYNLTTDAEIARFGWYVTKTNRGNDEFTFNPGEFAPKPYNPSVGFDVLINDLVSFNRWIRFKYTDEYGFSTLSSSSNQIYAISKATIDNTVAGDPLRFKFNFIYGGNNNAVVDYDLTDDATFEIKGPRDSDFKPLLMDSKRQFSIDAEDYQFGNEWTIRVTDGYGGKFPDYTLTLMPEPQPGKENNIRLVIEDGKVVPQYRATEKIYPNASPKSEFNTLPDEVVDAAGITYSWTIVYKDEDGNEIDRETPNPTTNWIDELKPYRAFITVVASDKDDNTREVTVPYEVGVTPSLYYVDVERSENPTTFTATLRNQNGIKIKGGIWQWYGVNGDLTEDTSNQFELTGETSNVLTLNATNNNYSSYFVKWTRDDGTITKKGFWSNVNVIYVYNKTQTEDFNENKDGTVQDRNVGRYTAFLTNNYPDGDDILHDGRTPQTAVQSMATAYSLLNPAKSAKENIIVVMGFYEDKKYLRVQGENGYTNDYDRNATITGNYGEISDGMIVMRSSGNYESGDGNGLLVLGGATIFKDITFYGHRTKNKNNGNVSADGEVYVYCQLHDLTFANGVKIEAYGSISANTNGLTDASAPKVHLIGGMHNYAGKLEYPASNAVQGQTTITIYSGCFGRIMASARNAGTGLNFKSHNIFGHPDHPHRVEVNIAIKHAPSTDGLNEYTPDITNKNNLYKYDIGLLVGGQTDGSIYVESKLNMVEGKVGRFISGNISFGRNATGRDGDPEKDKFFPSDGFYGSTTLTLEGGEIGELVGGTLGRFEASANQGVTDKCEAYFYGRSILNINGGVINGNIYGAGAGGVTGLHKVDEKGNVVVIEGADWHTKDKTIPYYTDGEDYNGYRNIAYGDYDAAKNDIPQMKMLKEDNNLKVGSDDKRNILDLADSYCEVNISGGVVKGDVFGGAYGYSKQVEVVKALDQAGNLYGNSYVTINGGTVKGNVYGGGAGAAEYVWHRIAQKYYVDRIAYYQTPAGGKYGEASAISLAKSDREKFIKLHKTEWLNKSIAPALTTDYGIDNDDITEAYATFSDLANVFGNVNVTITGGIIEGKVFAGAKGIAGFPKMATLFGDTKLLVENVELSDNTTRVPIINKNIYGGSELGEITGDTNVDIKGGAIGNCIFGGSEGIESGTDKTTAVIGGSTNLTITDGTYFTDAYAAKISTENRIAAAERTFNIYGGGYRNCIVNGNTNVTIKKSLLTSYQCLIEPDPKDASKKRSFEDCVKDETYRKFSVYGAGRGELTDVKGDAVLNVNIEGGASVPSVKPVDVANNQQFFMIAGGGMAGHVWKDTKVTLDGNVFARRVYGAGMYGNVIGDANITVRRGSYYGVFGGGLLGNVKGNANLRIGTKAGKDEIDPSITVSFDDAAEANRNLYIYDNVYGGNDVSGCTGYETTDSLWNDGDIAHISSLSVGQNFLADGATFDMGETNANHHYLFEHWSGFNKYNVEGEPEKPYYRHLIRASETKGVNMKIYGGRILGDVFGAGNGNHMGYYVPNMADSESHSKKDYEDGKLTRMKFYEGLPYHYRVNKKDANSYEGTPTYNSTTNTYTGTLRSVLNPDIREKYGLYEYRPRVGKVVMHIGGNSEGDRVYIGGDVYGGGHACTIGMYDPARDVLTDPLRFEGGGSLKMNFGSHVTVQKSVYMGSRGRIIGQQTVKGEHDYNDVTLNSDMDYHYYDHDKKKYLLGFPNTKEGRMRFHAYVQLVNMDAVTELSFYDQTDNKESKDVRWGSFFAGGARGSMTKRILAENDKDITDAGGKTSDLYKKTRPYEYTLPAGLTVETRVVGGSEDAEITYYEYTDETFTAINDKKPLFTFKGGIVYDKHTAGHYGGGQVYWNGWKNSDETVAPADTLVGDESPRGSLTVMKLNVNCQFDPQKIAGVNDNYEDLKKILTEEELKKEEDTFEDYYGGLVYGGCYNSGITNGSVEVKCTNNLLGEHFTSDDYHDYLSWSSLRRNIGRVYGGGFGKEATILGNTKVTLTDNARCFNVFGGGMVGDVTGGTEIEISGLTSVYNAVYGGSLRGNIGKEIYDYDDEATGHVGSDGDLYAKGTHVRLISGGVERVYGGGFIGTIYGGTHVVASDEDQPAGTPRLMVGSIFGGNDVSGDVFEDKNEKTKGTTGDVNPAKGYSTFIRVNEAPRADKKNYTMSHQEENKDESTGVITKTDKYYGGFPLIGSIYGAGNGNMADYIKGVYIGQDDHEYKRGFIHIASGNGADYHTLNLGNREGTGKAYTLPDIAGKTKITINGGTIVNVYGGGSMSTVKGSDEVVVNYTDTVARAAVPTNSIDPMTWGVLRLFEDLQQQEVTTTYNEQRNAGGAVTQPEILRFSYQIYRVFGGNNLMDMAIQPKLDLRRGQLFSVYSGGNFGRMTYIRDTDDNPDRDPDQPRGLSLTIKYPDIRIAAVYGGGRVGDIHPMFKLKKDGKTVHVDPADFNATDYPGYSFTEDQKKFAENEYGATLNIQNGLIGDVYGGNNVAGTVYNGTNVNISGAISGNVYGSGNGNYIYYYDHDGSKSDPIVANQVTEGYDEAYGGRYFILPKKVAYVEGSETVYYGDTPEDKILAINSYRPNVDKAYLYIEGTEDSQVYVRGSVYCGGNSSTVLYNQDPELSKIKFKIGNYVTLGGVFLGSNGEGLANANNITWLGNLNGITDWSIAPTKRIGADATVYPVHADYTKLYPNLLALYMRAAEVTALPTGFADDEFGGKTLTEAHIGNFTIGGNRGSMMTDQTITMTLPESLVIFGRVVGGCYNSCVEYHGVEAHGGMPKPLAGTATDKLNLTIKSKFRPWRLLFNEDTHAISLVNDRTDADGNYVPTDSIKAGATYYYGDDRCDIFGGCYTSGKTVGNINIDLYSDVLGRYETSATSTVEDGETILTDAKGRYIQVNRKQMMNNVATRQTVYALTGAGYGPESVVEGNVHLRLMPTVPSGSVAGSHPSISTIFGGAHNGKHIGNSTTEIRDGMVFSNLYAGSRAAFKYGSSEVIVGYPKYYICKTTGEYTLDRADKYTDVAKTNKLNADGTPVIKKTVKYMAGDIVAANVVEQIRKYRSSAISEFSGISKISDYFTEKQELPTTLKTLEGNALVSSWDDISINIGDNSAMNNTTAHFYGGGGIYGGGHALNESAVSYSGKYTQLAYGAKVNETGTVVDYEADTYLNAADKGYGGNSTIVVGDNTAGSETQSHISIGTGHYVVVKLDTTKGDKIGKYVRKVETVDGVEKVRFVHQSSGTPSATETYYEMAAEGGIYGDGRRTFVQGFRAVDISGYGYADYAPQSAKLINSFQRIDLLSLTDCCLQLQGAQDYATNTIDATIYSIARIGELRMNSTLTGDIPASVPDTEIDGNMALKTPRSRNYLGFFNNVHYVGAMVSNTDFDSTYRGADGKTTTTTGETTTTNDSYWKVKKDSITAYETPLASTLTAEEKTAAESAKVLAFKKRNLATAPNMIGINNGYTLRLNNAFTTDATTSSGMLSEVPVDNIYYGPIVGVMEVKLLTLAQDEGGGYIYAFNQHEDNTGEGAAKTFLEETGNFVYPSAIDGNDNYIVDDCYPQGYYVTPANATTEEIHYWYVQGHHYYFNTTLTAYTYNQKINFKLNNTDEMILLSGITPATGSTINIKDIIWEEHVEHDDSCALTNNLNAAGEDSRNGYQLYLTIDKNTGNEYDLKKNDAGTAYTNVGNAFVARIPNGNYVTDDAGNVVETSYGAGTDGKIQFANNYSNKSETDINSPLLGIRLQDTDTLNYKPDFYKAHLTDDDNLVINITATDAGDSQQNTYTIRLKIVYLQGPYIDGKVTIENCALPGEYIYANTGKVQMEMDDALTVTGKKWFLYPRLKDNPEHEIYKWGYDNPVDVSKYLMDNITGEVNRLQLPARYYQNDWKLGYSIIVNGQPFPLPEPTGDDAYSNHITVHNYHRMSTVATEVKKGKTYGYDLDLDLVGGALVYIEDDEDFEIFTKYVNYCNEFRKEKPADAGGYLYRLALPDASPDNPEESTAPEAVVWQKDKVGGKWARVLRAEVLPGYNAKGKITGYSNSNTILGLDDNEDVLYQNVKNPSGAENIRFILAKDIKVTKDCEPIKEFRGNFNGNGHIISFEYDPDTHKSAYTGENFIELNYGNIRDVGFVTNGADNYKVKNATAVIKYNRGNIDNAFYFHYPEGEIGANGDYSAGETGENRPKYAVLIDKNQSSTSSDDHEYHGTADNCYQNTNSVNAAATTGVSYYRSEAFHYGLVAYNLNKEYLKARHDSKDDGSHVHDNMSTDNVLYNYYADGDYRYANVRSAEHPEGLRLTENFGRPNYNNFTNSGRSMHETDKDKAHDERRWFRVSTNKVVKRDERGNIVYTTDASNNIVPVMTNEGYFPIYLYDAQGNLADHSDFIFFGQRLVPDAAHRQHYPKRIGSENRVYRAGGFYGSRVDRGFHFNREAWAMQPTLTAIDFTGHLDQKNPSDEGKPYYEERWQYYLRTNEVDGAYTEQTVHHGATDVITGDTLMQLAYYPPMLDLPGGDDKSNLHNLVSFDVVSNADINDYSKITKNLLVYTPAVSTETGKFNAADNTRLFSDLHYTRMQKYGEGETDQNDIIGHHLYWVNHTGSLEPHFHASNELFHLVDEQNFNAPIKFVVAGDGDTGVSTDGRAWMLRKPKKYSSRITTPDVATGFTVSKDAWESIALPFTCNRVWAVNSGDYNGKYSRGQISHFYGDSDTHHDYWLRGLVGAEIDNCGLSDNVKETAMFARPGRPDKDSGLFHVKGDINNDGTATNQQMLGDYKYFNNWFFESYKGVAYSQTHNEYADSILFADYCYLTKNAPYIIAFPGEDYYEFDLSGKFFNDKHATTGCHEQEILYEFRVENVAEGKGFDASTQSVTIPVTDVYDAVRTTKVKHDGNYTTSHCATFMRIAADQITDDMYVLNPKPIPSMKIHSATANVDVLPVGSVFVRVKDMHDLMDWDAWHEDSMAILPFRTYLKVTGPSGVAPRPFIVIGNGLSGNEDFGEQGGEEQKPEYHGVNLYVEDNNLVITSDQDTVVNLFGISGQLYRRLTVHAGMNVYRGLNTGVYIALGKKFVIRR